LNRDYIKEKDEPARLAKGNANIQKSVDHMKNEKTKSDQLLDERKKMNEKMNQRLKELSDQVQA